MEGDTVIFYSSAVNGREKRTVRNKSKTGGLNYADFSFKFKRTLC